jgi:hypothetical protein
MNSISTLFPDSYEASRLRFRQNLTLIRAQWPSATIDHHTLAEHQDLTIDWIWSPGLKENARLLLFTTGEHGIEGYVGSAMLQRFIQAYLPLLNPDDTGILLLHAINPWGMKYRRRTNSNNVDLNRNFVTGAGEIDAAFNPEYTRLDGFLNPKNQVHSYALNNLAFLTRLAAYSLTMGLSNLRHTTLLGQYRHAKGIHAGGDCLQEETRVIMDLYRKAYGQYDHVVHLDMHTGYGPRYQMSLVNSALDPTSSAEYTQRFDFPLVMAANAEEFYAIRGDMIDYIYAMVQHEFPGKRFYATSFEFGTYGLSTSALIKSLRSMMFENQVYWHGASNSDVQTRIQHDFEELFFPEEERWRAKAVADAEQAFDGILKAEGFI